MRCWLRGFALRHCCGLNSSAIIGKTLQTNCGSTWDEVKAMSDADKLKKRKRGRPPKKLDKIPDTFQNVVKALVRPVSNKKAGK